MRFCAPAAAAALAALAAAPAFAQRLGQNEGVDMPVWRILGALLFCLALALAAAIVLRRRLNGPNPLVFGRARRLALVESLRLSHQVDLCIVSLDGRELLLASTPHGATLIDPSLPAAAPAKDAE